MEVSGRTVWFNLVEQANGAALTTKTLSFVQLPSGAVFAAEIPRAIRADNPKYFRDVDAEELKLYRDREAFERGQPIHGHDHLSSLPTQTPLFVTMPRPGAHVPAVLDATGETGVEARLGVTDTSVPGAQLAPMTMLHSQEEFEHECNLVEWEAGAVNRIPLIWDFMKTLGGCSESGNIFWRWEDKQLVSLLLEGWFGTPRFLSLRNKRSVVVGSPGIGKSTLLCVLAFYLVFKRKKSVLVYRKLQDDSVNCLFFWGYNGGESEDAGRVVFSTLLRCKYTTAADIYEGLIARRGAENIWLLLDGLDYNQIPEGLQSFKLLATSQQVDIIKPYARDGTYRCLLSAWKREDIFKLGEELHHFSEEDMVERFYYSGGSVREFCRETEAEIKAVVDEVVELVENPGRLQLSESVELSLTIYDARSS